LKISNQNFDNQIIAKPDQIEPKADNERKKLKEELERSQKDVMKLKAKLRSVKTYQSMMIHEIKHPIEGMKDLHERQINNLNVIIENTDFLQNRILELIEMDEIEERSAFRTHLFTNNSSNLNGKQEKSPKEQFIEKFSKLVDSLDLTQEFQELYTFKVSNSLTRGLRLSVEKSKF
jgi:nitrogen-specific signal transduction histidine kinase